MSRLGIFCFYDPDGVVDSYIKYLLDELMTVLDDLVIVVNGTLEEQGRILFERYTDEILIRENVGFDGGAYADVIVNYLGERLKNWDEVVLCNDTFFGPFVPFKSIFKHMEATNADFWGLNLFDRKIILYVESYFLVFRKKVIQSEVLFDFFQHNIDQNETVFLKNCVQFEHILTHYLSERQYTFDTYTNTRRQNFFQQPYQCIQHRLPIIKKKAFAEKYRNFQELRKALQYLKDHSDYDIAHILRHARRRFHFDWRYESADNQTTEPALSPTARYSETELATHIGSKDFYIYGTGSVAYELFSLFLHKFPRLRGFVVSDDQTVQEDTFFGVPVFRYSKVPKDAMLVLCVCKKNTEDIKPTIAKSHEIIELWE